MDLSTVFQSLGTALGLGLLVGLQRERVGSKLAGVRTFPLIALLGAMAALVAQRVQGGGWIVAAGFLSVAAATAVGNFLVLQEEHQRDMGVTTEVAVLLVYAIGAYAAVGEAAVALAAGAAVAVLLHAKGPMHGLVARIGDKDMRA